MLSRRPVHELARTPPQNWVFPWADVDLDFAHGRYFQKGQGTSISNLITCSRASPRLAQYSNGTWASFGNNVPAITDLGLTAFESRTNSIRNSTMQGAVIGDIGSGGSLPTNWTRGNDTATTLTVVGTGAQFGLSYIDLRWHGTAGSGTTTLLFEVNTAITAAVGQTWDGSLFAQLVGGTTTNVTAIGMSVSGRTNTGAANESSPTTVFLPTINNFTRKDISYTLATTGSVFVNGILLINYTNGAAVDFTLRIWQPQLEGTAITFAGPPIPTSGSAATAAADVITLANVPTFGGSYTLLGKGYRFGASQIGAILMIDDGSDGSNRSELFSNSNGTTPSMLGQTGGTFYLNQAVATGQILGAPGTLAVAFAPNDQAGVFNGGTPSTNSTGTPIKSPTVTTVQIGGQPSGFYWNGNIQRIALSATLRVPNSTLVSSTK